MEIELDRPQPCTAVAIRRGAMVAGGWMQFGPDSGFPAEMVNVLMLPRRNRKDVGPPFRHITGNLL